MFEQIFNNASAIRMVMPTQLRQNTTQIQADKFLMT